MFSTSACANTAGHAAAGRVEPRTLPRGLEHVLCKVQMWAKQEPRLQEHSPHPTSHKDFVKMPQGALLFVKRSVSDKPRTTFCKNKWHLLLYSNKSSEETGLKYQRKTLMCCSGNLPWWGDLIFTIALETSSLLEYCNQQRQLPEQRGQQEPGMPKGTLPSSFPRLLTENKHWGWAFFHLCLWLRSLPGIVCLNLFQPESPRCGSRTTLQLLQTQAEELPTIREGPFFFNGTTSGSVQHLLTA